MPVVGALTDDFTTKDTSKWTWGGTASVVSGQANFIPLTSYANSINTGTIYSLTGSAVVVQVVQTSPTGTTGTLENWVEMDSGAGAAPMVMWRKLGANLVAAWRNASSVETDLATFAYNSTTHAWWRIQESGGTTTWDTSPDGVVWTNRASLANPFTYTSSMGVDIGAGYTGTEGTPGTFIIDNLNLPPVSGRNPTGVAGLSLRWRASDIAQGNGTAVSSWPNAVGGGAAALVQATGGAQPTYTTGAANGRPVVRFDGSTDFMTATLSTAAQPVSVVVMHKANGLPTAGSFMELFDSSGIQMIYGNGANTYDCWAGTTDEFFGTPNTTSYRCLGFVVNGASSNIWLDGSLLASNVNPGTTAITTTLYVGRQQSTSARFLNGDVAEILVYNRALSTADMAVIDTYAQDTYGITVADYIPAGNPRPPDVVTTVTRIRAANF